MIEGSNTPFSDNPTMAELARELLLYKMQEYSEAMCASWLTDAEFEVWELGEPGACNPRGAEWERQNAVACRKLGEISSGWWVYDPAPKPGKPGWTGENPHFIPLIEWRERQVAWRAAQLKYSQEQAREAAEKGMATEAVAPWEAVPALEQSALFDEVWCCHCRVVHRWLGVTGCQMTFLGGGVWLTGTCAGCGGLLHTTCREVDAARRI